MEGMYDNKSGASAPDKAGAAVDEESKVKNIDDLGLDEKDKGRSDHDVENNNLIHVCRIKSSSLNPSEEEGGLPINSDCAADEIKGQDVTDTNGKISPMSDEKEALLSGSNEPETKPKQRRRSHSKIKRKKSNGLRRRSSESQLEDGALPDMTGKEILVEQSELEPAEPVKEEIDLDELILVEEQSLSFNKWKRGGSSDNISAGAEATGVNRRGLMSRSRSQKSIGSTSGAGGRSQRSRSQKSMLTSSSTTGGTGGNNRSQLFALYKDLSQKSLQTQTTMGTSGLTHEDVEQPIPEPSTAAPPRNQRPLNSRRDRTSSVHSSLKHSKSTLGRIPSGEILSSQENGNVGRRNMPSRNESWSDLIAMDERSKRNSIEIEDVDEEVSNTSSTLPNRSHKSNGPHTSYKSKGSGSSKHSHGSQESGSRHSKPSKSDRRSRRRNSQSHPSESWRNESTFIVPTLGQMKDPEYIRTQASERFERGLDYAEYGKLEAARERFLVALRYRVMDRGSLHPDIAATHEMLGLVEFLLAENEKNDNIEENVVELDEGHDGLVGGNLTIMEKPNKDNSNPSIRGRSHYEKAAMHFQTAMDILDAKELGIGNEKVPSLTSSTSFKDETAFQWKELVETYSILDEKGRLGVEERIEIVSRIQERMDDLPVMVGQKSYATPFLFSSTSAK